MLHFLIQIVCHKSIINKGEAVKLMSFTCENPTVERVNSNMYSVFSSVLYVCFLMNKCILQDRSK
jgi:hypothetical protein